MGNLIACLKSVSIGGRTESLAYLNVSHSPSFIERNQVKQGNRVTKKTIPNILISRQVNKDKCQIPRMQLCGDSKVNSFYRRLLITTTWHNMYLAGSRVHAKIQNYKKCNICSLPIGWCKVEQRHLVTIWVRQVLWLDKITDSPDSAFELFCIFNICILASQLTSCRIISFEL